MKKLLNVKEVADRLNVTESAVRKWVLERRIGFQKVGRLLRFSEKNIEDFLGGLSND